MVLPCGYNFFRVDLVVKIEFCRCIFLHLLFLLHHCIVVEYHRTEMYHERNISLFVDVSFDSERQQEDSLANVPCGNKSVVGVDVGFWK